MKKAVLVPVIGLLAVVPALAATRSEHHFSLSFSSKTAHSPTGIKFVTDRYAYKAPAQGKSPLRVVTTTFIMNPRTRTNPGAYPPCNETALATNPNACTKSKVGTGSAVVITGIPIFDPLNMKATVFAIRGGLLTQLTGSGITQAIKLKMAGNRIVANVPQKCIVANDCSKGEAILKTLKVTLSGSKLVTTPPRCPASGKWTNTVVYSYANGDTEKRTSTSPCRR